MAEVDELLRLPADLREHLLGLAEELLGLGEAAVNPRVRQLVALVKLDMRCEAGPEVGHEFFGVEELRTRASDQVVGFVGPLHDLHVLVRNTTSPALSVSNFIRRV
jgi:hypothetical protein